MRAALFDALDLRDVTLVGQDWGGLIGLRLVGEHPDRFARVVAANTFLPTGDTAAGRRVPQLAALLAGGRRLRGRLHRRRPAAPPSRSPTTSSRRTTRRSPTTRTRRAHASSRRSCRPAPTIPRRRRTATRGRRCARWTSRSSPPSPTRTRSPRAATRAFQRDVPGCAGQPHTTIEGGGHFLQEDRGERLAQVIAELDRGVVGHRRLRAARRGPRDRANRVALRHRPVRPRALRTAATRSSPPSTRNAPGWTQPTCASASPATSAT